MCACQGTEQGDVQRDVTANPNKRLITVRTVNYPEGNPGERLIIRKGFGGTDNRLVPFETLALRDTTSGCQSSDRYMQQCYGTGGATQHVPTILSEISSLSPGKGLQHKRSCHATVPLRYQITELRSLKFGLCLEITQHFSAQTGVLYLLDVGAIGLDLSGTSQ
jgi:hypothetical protein